MRSKAKFVLVGGLALLCLLLLFFGGLTAASPRSYRTAWDLGHLVCFGLWTYLYLQWRPTQTFRRQLTTVLLLAFFVGGATELLQMALGREGSWADLGKDLLGSLMVVLFAAPGRHQLRGWLLRGGQGLVLVMLVWGGLPLARLVSDEVIAAQQFPLLSGFETTWEETRWVGNSRRRVDHSIAYRGDASLRIEFTTDRYSGAFQQYCLGDWQGYYQLELQVFNPDAEPMEIHFRVHDHEHRSHQNAYSDRFNTSIMLQPGWNRLAFALEEIRRAPRERTMDLGQIAAFGVFVGKLDQPRSINIDEVRLVH